MTIQQLRYIVAVQENGHFGKAAEACGLTQSTLSLMIKKLEEELDVRIFDRDSHPVRATEVGQKIIDKARVILFNVNQLAEITRTEKQIISGPLRIALISTVSPVLVPGLFKYVETNYPSVSLETEEMPTETIMQKLHRTEVDMAIVTGPVKDPGLLEIPLYRERFYVYVSENHPLAKRETVTPEDMASEPIWTMKHGLKREDLNEMRKAGEMAYERFFEGGRVGMLVQIVNENGGMTIVPETHKDLILFSHQKGLKMIVNPERRRTISLVMRNDYIHEAMMNLVVSAIKSIIPSHFWENVIRQESLTL